jgi:hypothetical protein
MSVFHLNEFINSKAEKLSLVMEESEMISQIRSFLFKNYIKTVVEQVNETDEGFRMCFIGNRFKSDFSNPISKECNGAIFYYNRLYKKFTPLVIPTPLFNSQKLVKKNIESIYKAGNYDVYPIMDGTIMNLYYYKNSWRISTNKAYDATDLVMFSNKTYNDVLSECLSYENNKKIMEYLNVQTLNTSKCYSLCVKNSGFHVFQNYNKVSLIQQCCLQTGFKEDVESDYKCFKSNAGMTWKDLNNKINSAVSSFKKHGNNLTYVPFLGVILRNNNSDEYSNVLLESNLMTKIRNFLYNFSFSKNLIYKNPFNMSLETKSPSSYYDMTLVNRLNIYLNRRDVNLFLSLFPQFKQEFAEYNQFIIFLTTFIMKNINVLDKNTFHIQKIIEGDMNLELSKLPEHQDAAIDMSHIYKNNLSKLSLIIVSELQLKKIIISQTQEGWNILNDFLINTKFLDNYYSFMHKD